MRRRRELVLALQLIVRCLATFTFLIAAYYLIPIKDFGKVGEVVWLVLEFVLFAALVAWQVLRIVTARHPGLRAVEAMVVIVPLFLFIFARIYLELSLRSPGSFSVALDRSSSIYFTVTTFATVGFGDITPTTDGVRLLVSLQMLLDLVVLGLIVKLILGAAQRTVAQRQDQRAEETRKSQP